MRKRSAERSEFLNDIVTTAVEGGTGYWAYTSGYKWGDGQPTVATLTEIEAGMPGETKPRTMVLDADAVARGIGRIVKRTMPVVGMNGNPGGLHPSYVKLIAGASAINDGGDIDAELADIIAQAAMFNEIVYG